MHPRRAGGRRSLGTAASTFPAGAPRPARMPGTPGPPHASPTAVAALGTGNSQPSKLKVEGSSPFARFDDNPRHPVPSRAWAAGYGARVVDERRGRRSAPVQIPATKCHETRIWRSPWRSLVETNTEPLGIRSVHARSGRIPEASHAHVLSSAARACASIDSMRASTAASSRSIRLAPGSSI
jgi:hypothetical protein